MPRVRCAFDNVLIIPRNSSSMFSLPGSSHFSGIDNYHLEKEWEEEMLIEKRCNSISWAISRHRRPTVWRAALSSTRTFSFYQSAHKKFIWTITLWDTEIRRFNDLLISLSPMKDVEALLNIYDYVFLGFVYVKSFPGFDNFRQFF